MATVTSFPRREHEPAVDTVGLTPGDDNGIDLRRIFGAIRRRKVLIAGLMIVGTGVATLYANQLQPLYSARTTIVLEGQRSNVINIQSVAQGLPTDWRTNETEAAIIASHHVAAKVVDRLNLYDNPLYNPALMKIKPSLWQLALNKIKRLVGLHVPKAADTRPPDPWKGMPPAERHDAMRNYLADAFRAGLTVTPSETSRLITISYVSPDPEMAAAGANATAEAYILDQIQNKGDVTARASRWLDQRVKELRDRVVESETKMEQYRAKSGLVDVGDGSELKTQLAKLQNQLIDARTARAEAQARYDQVQSLMKGKNGENAVESAAAVLDSPLIQRLREQETAQTQKIAALSTQLRPEHPKMILARNELKDLQQKIRDEVSKIVHSLQNELDIAKVRVTNLEREQNRLQNEIEQQSQAMANLRALQAEVDANKQLFQTVLSRYKETKVVDDELQQADARVLSPANPPGGPFYPQKRLIIVAALFISAVFGITIAIALELMDTGFRSLGHLEAVTGVPGLGIIPALGKSEAGLLPHEAAIRHPNSPYGESVRSIRTGLLLSNVDAPPKTVMFTSAVSGEGKTSTALSIAALSARTGQRTIIVDCDLRHPSVHTVLGVPNALGLTNYLSGQCALDEVIDIDLASGMHYITAGGRTPHPTDMLGSQPMKALLAMLSQQYEAVFLDTPPLLAVSDTLVLARQIEKTAFVVRWEKTRRDTVAMAMRQLIDAGADIAGTVMTQVDLKKQARYGQSDTGYQYYYDRHMKYYTD